MRGRERILASSKKALKTIGLIKDKYCSVRFVLQHLEIWVKPLVGSSWALKFLCQHQGIFYPSEAFSCGFTLSPLCWWWDFSPVLLTWQTEELPLAGLEIFAPKGLDFFPGRVPSEWTPFTELGKHWHHFQFLCSFPKEQTKHSFLEWRTHYRLFSLVTLLASITFLREGTPCIDKVHCNVVLKGN